MHSRLLQGVLRARCSPSPSFGAATCFCSARAGWLAGWLAGISHAQSQPVRIVVPFSAGGAADTCARLLAQQWQEAGVARSIVIDNKPGAVGVIGSDNATKAAPDGNTLLMVTVGHAVNPFILSKLPYETRKDFVPVGMVASVPSLLVVGPDFKAS